jgi:Cu/Ag efflux protein CusF
MKITKIVANIAAVTFALASFNSAMAQSHDHDSHTPAAVAGQEMAMSEGEVKKVDKDAGRLTIKHGPLENLGMPGMTMVFGVKDASALDLLKAGDKIKFVAERLDGRFVVTQLDVQK